MINQIRMTLFVWLFGLIIKLIPGKYQDTWKWIAAMPVEDICESN